MAGAGIRIGREHIASAVNSLVLGYSAAALPLLLIFTQSGLAFGEVLTTETVAVELTHTLVGSIGLAASVPLTTAFACLVVARSTAPDRSRHHDWRDPADEQWPPTSRGRYPDPEPRDAFWTNEPW